MVEITKEIISAGKIEPVAGNNPVLLTNENYLWLVKRGSVDLFLTRIAQGKSAGQRHYLFSLNKGDLLFGISPKQNENTSGVIVTGLPGSELVKLEMTAFKDLLKTKPTLSKSIDNWISNFSNLAEKLPESPLTINGDNFTDLIFKIQEFNSVCLDSLIQKLENKLNRQKERYTIKEEKDAAYINDSLLEILTVIEEEPPVKFTNEEVNSLFQAVKVVGDYLGIEIQLPPEKDDKLKLKDIADASRIRYRKVVLDDQWWKTDSGPLITFWKERNSPVALIPDSPDSYYLHDPVTGREIKVTAEIAEKINPTAVTFYRPLPERVLNIKDIFSFAYRGFWLRDIIFLLLAGIAGGLLGLAIPRATAIIFDTIIPGGERGEIWQIALLLLVIVLVKSLFEITRSFAFVRLRTVLDFSVQSAIWDRLLSLPVPFFRKYTAGELAQKALSITKIRDLVSDVVVTSFLAGIFSIFYFLQMFLFSANLTLWASILVVISMMMTLGLGFFQKKYQRNLLRTQNQLSGFVLQLINGIPKIRVSASENRFFYQWSKRFSEQRKLTLKVQNFNNYLSTFNAAFPVVSSMIIFYLVAGETTSLKPGIFIAFNAAFISLQMAMLSLSQAFLQIMESLPLLENVKPILETVPEYDKQKKSPGKLSGRIEVSNLTFRYQEDGPLILKNVSIEIKPGEYVAFVGPSGSGKSTLLRLLLGFEKPLSGRIYYTEQDLENVNIKEVRKQLGIVLQNGQLMSGSIYSNIIGSSTDLTLDDAWDAARKAGLAEDIKKMPMGMQTIISQGQQTLSGGQKQRLLIARAIVNKPKIIFFDEATSALDNKTQSSVTKSLDQLDVTRLIIAHRLSTIRECDRIFVLDQGEIVEQGSYEDLMKQKSLFSELANRQLA